MKPVLTYYNMAEGVTAFSTTRHGGVSSGSYASLNINPYCGDKAANIVANRQLLAAELDVESSRVLLLHQVHGDGNRMVCEDFFAWDNATKSAFLDGADALMTDCRNLCIGVSTADCIPILLYDSSHHAVSAVHAGWRGTCKRIVCKTLRDMNFRYGTCAEDVIAVIGPGISQRNFEVGQEVYDAFLQEGHDMEAIAMRIEKWHLDLPLCNRIQLEEAGVEPANIHQSDICTYDAADDYFSARRLGIASGRIYTGIVLR